MPVTTGFNHIATQTADLDRFIEWYGKVFDAQVTFEMAAQPDHPRMAILDMGGGSALNVFEVPPESIIGDKTKMGGRGRIDHFGIQVDSLDTLREIEGRFKEMGADIGEIHPLGGMWSLFFRDVDGMELEVCAPGEAPS